MEQYAKNFLPILFSIYINGVADWAADGKTLFVTFADAAHRISLVRLGLDGRANVLRESTDSVIRGAVPSPDGHSLAIGEYHLGPTSIWKWSR